MITTHAPSSLRPVAILMSATLTALITTTASAQMLALKLIDRPASGIAINARGDVVGSRSYWPCANHQCAQVTELAVWKANGTRHLLPIPPGQNAVASAISPDGMVVGSLSDFASYGKAVVWRFNGTGYQMTPIGNLGLAQSYATGVDANERVVGYAITPFVATKPFVWTTTGGMTDLTLTGFPGERLWDVSPNGRVVSDAHTWQLDNIASVQALPAPPAGFRAANGQGARINDAGDLAINLLTTSSQPLSGMHRYAASSGQWQALAAPQPLIYGFGGHAIEADATILGRGFYGAVIANGPDGLPAPLQAHLSPAYVHPSLAMGTAYGRNAKGEILVSWLGAALAVPIKPCVGTCLKVSELAITGHVIQDPKHPGSCTNKARNQVDTVVTVTDSAGVPQSGVKVQGRYFDDYDLNQVVRGQTGANGKTTLSHTGPACVGTISLLVESAKLAGSRFDRGTGTLFTNVIPTP